MVSVGQGLSQVTVSLHKCINVFMALPPNMIVMASDVSVRNTRNTDSLNVYIPKPNIECYRNSFKYAGGKIWNDLPNNIQNAPSVDAFKYACMKLNFKHRRTHWWVKFLLMNYFILF